MLAGMSAGVVASIFAVTPTERIKTALIDDARNAKRFRSAPHAVALVYKKNGLLGMYRGFVGTTLKQASATAFRMGTYNILKDFEQTRQITQNTAVNFANGAVAGIITTYATQPYVISRPWVAVYVLIFCVTSLVSRANCSNNTSHSSEILRVGRLTYNLSIGLTRSRQGHRAPRGRALLRHSQPYWPMTVSEGSGEERL